MQHLVLLGLGHAHIQVLRHLAQLKTKGNPKDKESLAQLQIFLVTPESRYTYSGMLPGWVAGHYAKADIQLSTLALSQAAGVQWIPVSATGINHQKQTVQFSGKEQLAFHTLSINIGGVHDVVAIDKAMDRLDTAGGNTVVELMRLAGCLGCGQDIIMPHPVQLPMPLMSGGNRFCPRHPSQGNP